MGQRSNVAAVKDAQTLPGKEECAEDMGQTITLMTNLLLLGQSTRRLLQLLGQSTRRLLQL